MKRTAISPQEAVESMPEDLGAKGTAGAGMHRSPSVGVDGAAPYKRGPQLCGEHVAEHGAHEEAMPSAS